MSLSNKRHASQNSMEDSPNQLMNLSVSTKKYKIQLCTRLAILLSVLHNKLPKELRITTIDKLRVNA
jgi:hypothetical protein